MLLPRARGSRLIDADVSASGPSAVLSALRERMAQADLGPWWLVSGSDTNRSLLCSPGC
jgi:hypothetical protein